MTTLILLSLHMFTKYYVLCPFAWSTIDNAVEQVEEESVTVANPDPPVTTTIPVHPTISTSISTPPENTARESPVEDVEMPAVTESTPHHGRSNSDPVSPTSIEAPSPSSGAFVTPLQIAIPQSASGSRLSANIGSSSSQQSPSSAFFLAPSPPAFISGFGVAPIPFSTPSSSSSRSQPSSQAPQSPPPQSHNAHSVSPSNHMSHMFQNFVRNITIPSRSRSRSRTNSNSASLSPVAPTTPSTTPSQGSSHHHGILSHLHLHHHHNNEGHTDVFGKTLVVSPTPIMMPNARHNISELGSVSEIESEPVSRDDSSNSSGRSSRGGDEMSDDVQASGEPSTTSLAQVTPSEAQPVVV